MTIKSERSPVHKIRPTLNRPRERIQTHFVWYELLHLELLEVNIELLGCLINSSHLIHSLDSFGTDAKFDIAVEFFGEEALGLKINMLDLLDALVRESDYTGLTVGGLSQQVADSCPHGHIRPIGDTALENDNGSKCETYTVKLGNHFERPWEDRPSPIHRKCMRRPPSLINRLELCIPAEPVQ